MGFDFLSAVLFLQKVYLLVGWIVVVVYFFTRYSQLSDSFVTSHSHGRVSNCPHHIDAFLASRALFLFSFALTFIPIRYLPVVFVWSIYRFDYDVPSIVYFSLPPMG